MRGCARSKLDGLVASATSRALIHDWTSPAHSPQFIFVMALFGILNIDKPAGCTSRDAVNRVERLVRPSKAGHAGTLDPLASGVLVICVGKATRLIQYVQRMRKQYRATFLLGRRSETDDVEGEVAVLAEAPIPDREHIDKILPRFLGEISQRPPAHSAIKVNGRRAYKLARQGTAPELAARMVTIHSLRVERYDYPQLELSLECGSGTYIRALGRDLAAALGTAAVMSALRRTAIGGFHVEHGLAVDELSHETLAGQLQSPLAAVADMPRISLTDEQLNEIRHGRPISVPQLGSPAADFGALGSTELAEVSRVEAASPSGTESPSEWAAVDAAGQLVAILQEKRSGQLWPAKIFV